MNKKAKGSFGMIIFALVIAGAIYYFFILNNGAYNPFVPGYACNLSGGVWSTGTNYVYDGDTGKLISSTQVSFCSCSSADGFYPSGDKCKKVDNTMINACTNVQTSSLNCQYYLGSCQCSYKTDSTKICNFNIITAINAAHCEVNPGGIPGQNGLCVCYSK